MPLSLPLECCELLYWSTLYDKTALVVLCVLSYIAPFTLHNTMLTSSAYQMHRSFLLAEGLKQYRVDWWLVRDEGV
jgi:hypothetical protein